MGVFGVGAEEEEERRKGGRGLRNLTTPHRRGGELCPPLFSQDLTHYMASIFLRLTLGLRNLLDV